MKHEPRIEWTGGNTVSQSDGRAQHAAACLWFEVERPEVGRVYVAHRGGRRVVATALADPPDGPVMNADDFIDYLRRKFGVAVDRDPNPDPAWPFNVVRKPFEAGNLVDLSSVTDFERGVMEVTASIPYGGVRTYGEVAEAIGKPKAAMAVGQAMKSNPAPLVIPCHRVVAKNDLGGWVYGEDLKWRLLKDEETPDPRRRPLRTSRPSAATRTSPVVAPRLSLEERIRRRESEGPS